MAINKQVNHIKCLIYMLADIKNSIADKFSKFYMKRIFDVDLAPTKTLSYNFALGSSGSSAHKRSLSKLKGLFSKYLMKVNPALHLTNAEFLPIDASQSTIILRMFDLHYRDELPEYDPKVLKKNRTRRGYAHIDTYVPTKVAMRDNPYEELEFFKSINCIRNLERYVKYMNYLARKNDVPIMLIVNKENIYEGDDMNANVKVQVNVTAHFVSWYCRRDSATNRYAQVKSTGVPDDALFADESLWDRTSLPDTLSTMDGYGFHISKFWIHLDKAIKVLTTLSRKVEYGYSAFTFRT